MFPDLIEVCLFLLIPHYQQMIALTMEATLIFQGHLHEGWNILYVSVNLHIFC